MPLLPYDLDLRKNDTERLIFCKSQIITSEEVALLIIKPSNAVPNANVSKNNVESIVGRFEERGWELQALKLIAGRESLIDQLIAHYPQPFFDSKTENVSTILSSEEQVRLEHIWGSEALEYPIYHPTQLVAMGLGSYETIAKVWHTARGEDNALLDVGSPAGINTVTTQKHSSYGKRRLLLVKQTDVLLFATPFFIVNGFTAELVTKFSRKGERIVAMVFGKKDSAFGLSYLREHIIGDTNPHHAKPGTIRYDALHVNEYHGRYPIVSLDTVGIENNVVHLSETISEAQREIQLWMPEVLWYPPSGPFAPDISLASWENMRKLYLQQRLPAQPLHATSPDPQSLMKSSSLPKSGTFPKVSVNMLAGGSAGRFFGYKIPEQMRNKFHVPLISLGGREYSFLELQLARLANKNYAYGIKAINIFAADSTVEALDRQLKGMQITSPYLADTLAKTSILTRHPVPRIVPLAEDLERDKRFVEYCRSHGLEIAKMAKAIAQSAGDIVSADGVISKKGPGHLSIMLHYIFHRLKRELEQGIELAYFHIGEDAAARPDARLFSYALQNNAIATIEVVESSSLDKGYLINAAGKLQLAETSKNLGVEKPFYLNTSRIIINTKGLAAFLAGGISEFMDMDDSQLRRAVSEKIIDKLTPRLEIKPIQNYTLWAGQFSYAVGQISEVLPTGFVICDEEFPKILTFKTKQELEEILPIISREYGPYLSFL